MKQHKIFKIITKSGLIRDYTCDTCNNSYPTLLSLKEDHPKLDESKIISTFKNNHGATNTMTQNENQASLKDMIYNV